VTIEEENKLLKAYIKYLKSMEFSKSDFPMELEDFLERKYDEYK